jgi:hypothetical protein
VIEHLSVPRDIPLKADFDCGGERRFRTALSNAATALAAVALSACAVSGRSQ